MYLIVLQISTGSFFQVKQWNIAIFIIKKLTPNAPVNVNKNQQVKKCLLKIDF